MAEREGTSGADLARAVLLGLGALTAVGLGLLMLPMLASLAFKIAIVGGAGYLGYRLLTRNKALGSGKSSKSLPSSRAARDGSDFDRRMRELDELDRRVDAELRRKS